MGRKDLPTGLGFYTDFEGLVEQYNEDFAIAKKIDPTVSELEFIKVHVLPQVEKWLKKEKPFVVAVAEKRFFDFLMNRLKELEGQRIVIPKPDNRVYIKKAKGRPKVKSLISYKWPGDIEVELPKLFECMIHENFIDKITSIENFKIIFSEHEVSDILPLKWTDSNRLLAFFLNEVFKPLDWQSIAGNGKLFLNKKGKLLNQNDLSVALSEIIRFGNPKGYERIENILKRIKNLKNLKSS